MTEMVFLCDKVDFFLLFSQGPSRHLRHFRHLRHLRMYFMFLSLMSLVLKLSYEIGGCELQYQQLMKPPKQCLGLCHLHPLA